MLRWILLSQNPQRIAQSLEFTHCSSNRQRSSGICLFSDDEVRDGTGRDPDTAEGSFS